MGSSGRMEPLCHLLPRWPSHRLRTGDRHFALFEREFLELPATRLAQRQVRRIPPTARLEEPAAPAESSIRTVFSSSRTRKPSSRTVKGASRAVFSSSRAGKASSRRDKLASRTGESGRRTVPGAGRASWVSQRFPGAAGVRWGQGPVCRRASAASQARPVASHPDLLAPTRGIEGQTLRAAASWLEAMTESRECAHHQMRLETSVQNPHHRPLLPH
jgi:hypothetical protein